jgi:hypothetical protein
MRQTVFTVHHLRAKLKSVVKPTANLTLNSMIFHKARPGCEFTCSIWRPFHLGQRIACLPL